jgi:hypothetical protein
MFEARAGGAGRHVRAQGRLFELGKLTVERERRLHAGTLALGCLDDSHADYDGSHWQELGRLTDQIAE